MTRDFALKREDLTLSGRLLHGMRDAILEGALPPGRHLSERELCEMFGVSRGLVREALQVLAAEDLITLIPHRGPMVARLDRQAARDLYRVRAALEGLACAEFTLHADPAQRADLRAIATRLQAMPPDAPPEALVSTKNDFYRCLLAGARNVTLAQLFTQLNNRIVRLRRLSLSQPGRLAATQHEIAAIVAAIDRGDAAAARHLAEAHVASAARAADDRFAELDGQTETTKGQ